MTDPVFVDAFAAGFGTAMVLWFTALVASNGVRLFRRVVGS